MSLHSGESERVADAAQVSSQEWYKLILSSLQTAVIQTEVQ